MPLPLAYSQAQLNASIVVLVIGLVIGVSGHIVRSRPMILTGIAIIGVFSAYFLFAVARVS